MVSFEKMAMHGLNAKDSFLYSAHLNEVERHQMAGDMMSAWSVMPNLLAQLVTFGVPP